MGYDSFSRKDSNHKTMKNTLEAMGAKVHDTHTVKDGFPDIVVGVHGLTLVGRFDIQQVKALLAAVENLTILEGANVLIEIKDGTKPPSGRKLTDDEMKWHATWKGQVAIANDDQEALALVGLQALI